MKLSGFITIILMVGLCFAMVGSIIGDFEKEYPEVDINESTLGGYDYSEQITEDATLLQGLIELMGNEKKGYIFRAVIGMLAIPVAFITAIVIIFKSMGMGISMLSKVAPEIGIPPFVIPFAVTALTIIIIWAAMSWWRKYQG